MNPVGATFKEVVEVVEVVTGATGLRWLFGYFWLFLRFGGGGHFRGGFDEFFKPEQIYEVDCPGLTSPALENFTWTKLPRPVYPLDEETTWTPPTDI